ncbi:DUF4255 domain-containing protein [Algoriphagus halophilus]|uniref:DUF4255 domain-containing protein n=1 Tax=Algoriphagus halophilus TaxID=226505 RepID=UPI0035902DAA
MIDTVMVQVRDLINQNFKNQHGFSENKVVISNLVDLDGSSPLEVDDKVVMFLLNLGEEPSLKNHSSRLGAFDGAGFQSKSPILYLHLHVVFCANFRNKKYIEGLNYLSQIVSFFNKNRIIDTCNFGAGVSKKIEKISFELCSLSFDSMSHIWSSIGAKILPSSIYKISLIAIDDSPMTGFVPAVSTTGENSRE